MDSDQKKFIEMYQEGYNKIHLDTPIDGDSPEDILAILNYAHSFLRLTDHKMMFSIFHELGYCNDGITTLEEKRKQDELAKHNELLLRKEKSEKIRNALMLKQKEIAQKLKEFEEMDEKIKQFQQKKVDQVKQQIKEETIKYKDELINSLKMNDLPLNSDLNKLEYRELQNIAKDLDIKANQTRDMLINEINSLQGEL